MQQRALFVVTFLVSFDSRCPSHDPSRTLCSPLVSAGAVPAAGSHSGIGMDHSETVRRRSLGATSVQQMHCNTTQPKRSIQQRLLPRGTHHREGIVVYTVSTGGYEKTFKEPIGGCVGADYLAFSEGGLGKTRVSKNTSCWQHRPLLAHLAPGILDDPRTKGMRNRMRLNDSAQVGGFYKLCPFKVDDLRPYKYAIFLDSTVILRAPLTSPIWQDVLCHTDIISAFEMCTPRPPSLFERCRHGYLKNELYATVAAAGIWPKYYGRTGQEAQDNLKRQWGYYSNETAFKEKWFLEHPDLPQHLSRSTWDPRREYGIWWVGLMVADLSNPETERFYDRWWIEHSNTTSQGQVTMAFTAWRLGLLPNSLPNHGVVGSWPGSNLHRKGPHGKR